KTSADKQRRECYRRLPDEYGPPPDIAFRCPGKPPVEPAEEPLQHPPAPCPWPQQQCRKSRAQGERVEGREENRNRDRHGELLIQAPRDPGDECGRDEDGGQ